ncbi:MAG: asparagine synthase C-terminal domain-containing protein [Nitrosopumilaceae archaeon]
MEKMTQDLIDQLEKTIIDSKLPKKIGVAFSGGVDSSLLAKMCTDQGFQVTLLTIGFESSHDIIFSKKVNEFLKLPHHIFEINQQSFDVVSSKIINNIKNDNLSWNENGIAFYYVANLAKDLKIDTVVTANGIDELFCGYNAYREAIKEGEKKVMELMESKLENETKMMNAINEICSEFNVKIVQPFLNDDFIQFAKKIPVQYKIQNEDDLLRKHIIRDVAKVKGVPEISVIQRKKALQYGSLIHKALIKSK